MIVSDYSASVRNKERWIREALEQLSYEDSIEVKPAVNHIGYRTRIRLQVQEGRVSFFNAQKSRSCAVLTPGLRHFVNELFDVSAANSTLFEGATHLDARAPDLDGMRGLTVYGGGQNYQQISSYLPETYLAEAASSEAPMQRFALSETLSHFVPLGCFMQINTNVNAEIRQSLLNDCLSDPPRTFWDLYAGVGNLSLMLASAGFEGGGEELNPQSVRAANRTLSSWGDRNRYLVSDARATNTARPQTVDLLIANPPRAGLREGVRLIDDMKPNRIFLMACALESLVKDLRALLARGYAIERIVGYDMFPWTSHVETTVLLRR